MALKEVRPRSLSGIYRLRKFIKTSRCRENLKAFVRFKSFSREGETRIAGNRSGLATDLSCGHKRVSVGKQMPLSQAACFRKAVSGRGTLRDHAGVEKGGIGFRWGLLLGKWRGKEWGSVRDVCVSTRVVRTGSGRVTVTGTRQALQYDATIYSHLAAFHGLIRAKKTRAFKPLYDLGNKGTNIDGRKIRAEKCPGERKSTKH